MEKPFKFGIIVWERNWDMTFPIEQLYEGLIR